MPIHRWIDEYRISDSYDEYIGGEDDNEFATAKWKSEGHEEIAELFK